jgi:hypothetical protein
MLPEPYNNCTNNVDSYNSNLTRILSNQTFAYTLEGCFNIYLQREVIKNCSCQDATTTKIPDSQSPICTSYLEMMCSFNLLKWFYSQNVKQLVKDECPLTCEQMTYSLSLSSMAYPSQFYFKYLKKHPVVLYHYNNDTSKITLESLKTKILAVNIYYEEMSYTYISQSPKMQLEDLISNFGGTLGLFIGNL